jgi:hypothetical protein
VAHHTEAFVGIDTSKLRNAVAIADGGRGAEVRYLGEFPATEAAIQKLVAKLAAKYRVPVENQIRTYSWCKPPRIGRQRIRPALFTVRDRGASLSKAKWVRVSL